MGCNIPIKAHVYSWLYNNIVGPVKLMEEHHEAAQERDIYCFFHPNI